MDQQLSILKQHPDYTIIGSEHHHYDPDEPNLPHSRFQVGFQVAGVLIPIHLFIGDVPDIFCNHLPGLSLDQVPELLHWDSSKSSLVDVFERQFHPFLFSRIRKLFPGEMRSQIKGLGIPELLVFSIPVSPQQQDVDSIKSVFDRSCEMVFSLLNSRVTILLPSSDDYTVQAMYKINIPAGTIEKTKYTLIPKNERVKLPTRGSLVDAIIQIEEQLQTKPIVDAKKEYMDQLLIDLPNAELLEYDRRGYTYMSFLVRDKETYAQKDTNRKSFCSR
jgi:hypothetical protein